MFIRALLLFCVGLGTMARCQDQEAYTAETFALHVKQVDEFMDRFNFRNNTLLLRYARQNYPDLVLDRKVVLKSLFNKFITWQPEEVNSFIADVSDSLRPQFVKFHNKEWYAYINCTVMYEGKKRYLDLVLKVERTKNGASKWVIVSAMAPFLNYTPKYDSTRMFIPKYHGVDLRDSTYEKIKFLHPMSHGIDFMNLDEVFTGTEDFKQYLWTGDLSEEVTTLLEKLKTPGLKYVQVNKVSYHFLQLRDWIMVIEYFNRGSNNSGWLISNIYRAGPPEKRIYKRDYLNIPQHD